METFLILLLAYLIGEIVVRTALGKARDAERRTIPSSAKAPRKAA
jgi:hypothetical protein